MQSERFCRRFISTVLLIGTCFSCQFTQAGMVELSIFGDTNTATPGNDFGLAVGDMVSLKAVFDYSEITGMGSEIVSFSDKPENLNLFLGDLTFTSDNHFGFSLGYPRLHLLDGSFSGLDYLGFSSLSAMPTLVYSSANNHCCGSDNWYGINGLQGFVSGNWDAETQEIAEIADIPEPAPLFLAGIGLLGAWISSRRKKKVFTI